ncbi:MAG TPA: sulfotransferase [Acidimicrobiia bacterium]|nr:sulfotransferase [Acidimicrobiia bacterium]
MTAPFLFVVGCNRSGTTLLRTMLDAHPELAVPPEAYFTVRILRRHPSSPGAGVDSMLDRLTAELEADGSYRNWALPRDALRATLAARPPESTADVLRSVYATYGATRGKARVADKTPRNVAHIDLIARSFPEARFLHLVRDGRDVVPSVIEHLVGPDRFLPTVEYWRERVLAGRRSGGQLPADRYLEIRYEDLVSDPAAAVTRIGEFAQLEHPERMLDYTERSESVLATVWDERRHQGITRPPTPGIRDWRTAMRPHDVDRFEALAGDALDAFGYDRSRARPPARARLEAFAWRRSARLRRAARPLTTGAERRRRDRRRAEAGAPPRRRARQAATEAR